MRLIEHLQNVQKYKVERVEAGIYYITGDLIPIQIIVTKELTEKENLWLKNLTDKLDGSETAKKLVEEYHQNIDNSLYKAVMETIVRENYEMFEEVNGMRDALMEIVQEKFDRRLEEETKKAVDRKMSEIREEATRLAKEEATKRVTEEVTNKVTEEVTEKQNLRNTSP